MKRVLMASRSINIFACVLFTVFLHATAMAQADAARRPESRSESGNSVIRIWVVGSPLTNELPPAVLRSELHQRAKELGHTLEVETFRAAGFAATFHQALQNHTEPEILTFDNYGVITGMRTRTGWVEGIDWDRRTASTLAAVHETMTALQPRGWVMLVRSAVNYEAARALSMRPPECEVPALRVMDSDATASALRLAHEKAMLATRAYLDCDRSMLAGISDEARMVQQCFQPQSVVKIESVKACNVLGNQKLAFVTLVAGFSAEVRDPRALVPSKPGMDLGQRSILAVLTNQSGANQTGTWRLLAITHDTANTVARIPLTTNTLVYKLGNGPASGIPIEPAQLLTPNGIFPVREGGERFGNFTWQPSQSPDVIGQVVEFMWGKETNWGLTRLFFLPANDNKLSTGAIMWGGQTPWRVWSISKSGDIVFSEQRSFTAGWAGQ